MYTFEKVDFDEVAKASKGIIITSVELFDPKECFDDIFECITFEGDRHFAIIFGKYQALFGEPNHISKDNDYLYIYCLKATAENGSIVYLCPYHGERGAAVFLPSALNNIDIEPYYAALGDLVALLNKTRSIDYKWKFHTKWGFKEFMTYEVVCNEPFIKFGYMDDISIFHPDYDRIYEEAKKGYY